jgi:hypothetical protein
MDIINKISFQLGIDSSEAKIFCDKVQEFFIGPKPSLIQISKEIDLFKRKSPSPLEIARQFAEKKKNNQNKKSQISKTSTDKTKSPTNSKDVKNKSTLKKKQNRDKPKKRKRKKNPNTGQNTKERNSENRFTHDIRNYQEDIKKCKHGVSVLQTCALCNPEKFKDDYGMD